MAYKDSEKKRATEAAYRAANKEKLAAQNAAYRARNREKLLAQQAAYYRANKEKVATREAANARKRKYAVTEQDYARMLEEQGGRCGMCFEPFDARRKPVVEHDHDNGRVRGIVHNHCNLGIGHLGDSLHRVVQAARYLIRSGQRLAEPHRITLTINQALQALAAEVPATT